MCIRDSDQAGPRSVFIELGQCVTSIGGRGRQVALLREKLRERLSYAEVVIDDEDAMGFGVNHVHDQTSRLGRVQPLCHRRFPYLSGIYQKPCYRREAGLNSTR